jgi:hypothetical protein
MYIRPFPLTKEQLAELKNQKQETPLEYLGMTIKLLFLILYPFAIGLLPVVPYIMTDNGAWMLGMFLTMPIACTCLHFSLKYLTK